MKKIECIIMDWAGSAVDYGCFAPVAAFLKAFEEIGITVTMEEARRPMGMAKIDHIRELFKMENIDRAFRERYQRSWSEEDVIRMNQRFEGFLFASLENYTEPIPGVLETIGKLKEEGLKIGSTTGYTRAMMDVVIPGAAGKGYRTDCCITPDGLPAGRPQPYMIYQNMISLGIPSTDSVLKYGDTLADIQEGVNAKVWTVGVLLGSNEIGLTPEETQALPVNKLETLKNTVRRRMLQAGAHYVADSICELPQIIRIINQKMNETR